MILITSRAREVAEWIDANCTSSSYMFTHFRLNHSIGPEEIELNLAPEDEVLFTINFAGWFIKHPEGSRWYDDNAINRAILELRVWGIRGD